jgi:hypothetical protein
MALVRPASATPTNTVFDRVVGGCPYDFEYGNFGAAYARYKVNGADPAGKNCLMLAVDVFYTPPTNGDWYDINTYSDNNVWHQAAKSSVTAYGAQWSIDVTSGGCDDYWTLQARFNDGDPEGYWTDHTYVC